MKMVFGLEEVAAALGQTIEEFNLLRPKLEKLGFPKPVRGLENRWSIIDVSNWVNGSQASSQTQFYAA